MRNVYKILVGKPQVKRPLGRPRRRWEDNIIKNVGNIGWEDVDWMNMSQDRDHWRTFVNMAMNVLVQ
jgi:hypothetical protein